MPVRSCLGGCLLALLFVLASGLWLMHREREAAWHAFQAQPTVEGLFDISQANPGRAEEADKLVFERALKSGDPREYRKYLDYTWGRHRAEMRDALWATLDRTKHPNAEDLRRLGDPVAVCVKLDGDLRIELDTGKQLIAWLKGYGLSARHEQSPRYAAVLLSGSCSFDDHESTVKAELTFQQAGKAFYARPVTFGVAHDTRRGGPAEKESVDLQEGLKRALDPR